MKYHVFGLSMNKYFTIYKTKVYNIVSPKNKIFIYYIICFFNEDYHLTNKI